MTGRYLAGGLLALLAFAAPVGARSTIENGAPAGGSGSPSDGYLQCVPYARQVSGIRIFGDAYTWWDQAEGRYARGQAPRVGAVMALRPHGNSRLGHVAAVSRIIDSRTVLIRHANWSERGKIEDDVRAVDVSPDNDWSEVRVWYGPAQRLGSGHWPLYGFIYNEKPGKRGKAKPARHSDDPIGDIIAGRLR
jgi:surface antigen